MPLTFKKRKKNEQMFWDQYSPPYYLWLQVKTVEGSLISLLQVRVQWYKCNGKTCGS